MFADTKIDMERVTDKCVFCLQYRSKISLGPPDNFYLFEKFVGGLE